MKQPLPQIWADGAFEWLLVIGRALAWLQLVRPMQGRAGRCSAAGLLVLVAVQPLGLAACGNVSRRAHIRPAGSRIRAHVTLFA